MSGRALRVLIVEDEAIVAADVEDLLGRAGIDVVGWTSRGEEALEIAGREAPDVILLDVRLRGSMDGVQVAESLREAGITSALVFLTAYSDGLVRDRVQHLEPVDLLYKPFAEEELLRMVRDTAG